MSHRARKLSLSVSEGSAVEEHVGAYPIKVMVQRLGPTAEAQ